MEININIIDNIITNSEIAVEIKKLFSELIIQNNRVESLLIEGRELLVKKLNTETDIKKRKTAFKNEISSATGEDGKKLYTNDAQRASAYEMYEREDVILSDAINRVKNMENLISVNEGEVRYGIEYIQALKLLIRTLSKEW